MDDDRTFESLGISEDRLAAIEAQGWTRPTPIQAQGIPPAMEGRDMVGVAQTGTGKTGAFMIPALERVEAGAGLQVLVLCPTRELAQQVAEDARLLAKGSTFRVADVVGGVGYEPQITALRGGWEIIAATPGRFNDHLARGNVDLSGVKVLVLDEADRMLDMGFRPQIEEVLRKAPRDRQTMLFSATMPNGVHALALRVTDDPAWIEATPSGTVADLIEEMIYMVKPQHKPELLLQLLGETGWNQVLVFTRTKAGADALSARLGREGIVTDAMHSDRQQRQRIRALERFSDGQTRVLVATDVAQRGLDVEGISHVVNYDVPLDPEDYVHRIGRTGRAGSAGTAVTFVTAGELGHLKSIEHRLGRSLERIALDEYGYSGESLASRKDDRPQHPRKAGGIGTRSADDLTEEELEALLGFES